MERIRSLNELSLYKIPGCDQQRTRYQAESEVFPAFKIKSI